MKRERLQRWLLFFIGGCTNTALTYGIYRGLIHFISYQWAYAIIYTLGIGFAYCYNSLLVFKKPLNWKGLFAYPLVYVIHYGLSAIALGVLVERLYFSEKWAPLLISIAMAPVIYILSKWVIAFTHKSQPSDP